MEDDVVAYAGASFRDDKCYRKSTTGILIELCGNLISRRSCKPTVVATSSAEA